MFGATLWDCNTFEDAFRAMNAGAINCEFYGLTWFLMHMHPSLPQDIRERYHITRSGPVVDGEIRRIVEAYSKLYNIHAFDVYASKKHGKRCTYIQGALLDLGCIPSYRDQVESILHEYSTQPLRRSSRKRQRV